MIDQIRILISEYTFPDGEISYIAQGIEADICVQSANRSDLMEGVRLALKLNAEECGGVENIGPAPDKFRERFEGNDPLFERTVMQLAER